MAACLLDKESTRSSFKSINANMHLVIDGIYLGDINAYKDWVFNAQLHPEDEFGVVSVTDMEGYPKPPANVHQLTINIIDDQSAWLSKDGIKEKLNVFFQFMDQARIEKKILLIHCMAGKSRSVTLLAAYLNVPCRQEYQSVLSFMRSKRFRVDPSTDMRSILSEQFQEMLLSMKVY